MKKIALVEGYFDSLNAADLEWLKNVREHHGQIRVALWLGDNWRGRAQALRELPVIYLVYPGRAKDIYPCLKEKDESAYIEIVPRETEIFKVA